jgi:hypothetical protein
MNCGSNFSHWHASLESPIDHSMRTFNKPQDLFDFLLEISNFTETTMNKEDNENEE